MQNTASIDLINLDFDTLKLSLISYLKSQDMFKDYDFEGSNLNTLIDLLAYNTQKNAFFYNMSFAEHWLDSAQLRDSVLSRAKELNYVPRSARSAKATVKVSFQATGESQPYVIQKGQSFSTLIKNNSYVFSIPETITVSSANNSFEFTADIYEGTYIKDSFIFSNQENQRFRISNPNVDTNSISVTVYEDNSVIGDHYIMSEYLLDVDDKSKVFFLQASEKNSYEILFGDGIIGRKPKLNSLIVLDYRICHAKDPNGARNFVLNFDPTSQEGVSELLDTPEIVTLSQAFGGEDIESNESVKYYAPRHFQVQQRTIIPSDYEVSLKTQFPEINAVSAIGGEDMNPPKFGKVYIAVDLSDVDGLPDLKKAEYEKFIRSRSPMKPIFIEPQYTYFAINSLVRYNENLTTNTPNTIKAIILSEINNYNENYLDDFNVTLRSSKFSSMIDTADSSIISNITDINLFKKLLPDTNIPINIVINFGVKINSSYKDERINPYNISSSIYSSSFVYKGISVHLEDKGGIIYIVSNSTRDELTNIGTVNYDTGIIKLNNITFDSYNDEYFKVYCEPLDKDISLPKDTIASIAHDEINIQIEMIKE